MERNRVKELADIGCPHSVTVHAGSSISFFSGQTALSSDWQVQGGDTVLGQAEYAIANLMTAIASIDAEPSHVAKLTIYLKEMDIEISTRLAELLNEHGLGDCATTVIGVNVIGIGNCMIEIDATVAK